ncbi:juvenile hormone esterase-like [Pieris napi]|uniref:juvenile hormone esterase-like n=1 Tax=Pieris napi TaxID=78633 RepID=UPI001FBBBCF7|nr:juvenile hormone esterase-like [Pieris napi]
MYRKTLTFSIRKINPVKFYHNKSDCHVTVPQGKMRGKVCSTPCGKQYYSFEGIPYAKPPLGPLRFRDPQKFDNWCGVFDATKPGNKPVQFNSYNKSIEGSEDCLYLNVYTPILPDEQQQSLPVLFFVYGGNLQRGCGHIYRPDYLIRQDVILVTINYRLHIFGFLNLETPEVPGNAGFKDAATALRWVKQNIEYFNGDSNNITGIGESAGAVITTLLLISKMTQGIFKRIIGLSTVLSDEMIGYNHLERAKDIASNLGNNINSSEEIDNLLRNCSPEDLTKALMKSVSRANENGIHSFIRPAVEKEYDNVEPFLDEYPLQSLRTNNYSKVPALMSVATHESAYLITPPSGQFKFNKDILKFVPSPALEDKDAVQLMDMEKQLKELYFKDKEIGHSTLVEYLNLVSDMYVTRDIIYTADLFSRNDDFYFCRFAYENSRVMKRLGVKGSTHSDILQFLFYTEKRRNTFSKQDMKLVDMLTEALCNFAKNGKPTWTGQEISWPYYKKDERICLNIDDKISCVPLPEYDRYTKLINILKQKPKLREQ